VGPSVALGVLA
jgi:hypothetical protein